MTETRDFGLEALFSADGDRFRDPAFVVETLARIGRVRRRRRLLGWSAVLVGVLAVGFASPWLIEAARVMSAALDIGFDTVGTLMREPAVLGAAVVVSALLAYRYRRRLL